MGSVTCMSRHASLLEEIASPPRASLFNSNKRPANNKRPEIVHIHNRDLHRERIAYLPIAMGDAAPQRGIPSRDLNIVDLVSDDEDLEYEGFIPLSASQPSASISASAPRQLNEPPHSPKAGDLADGDGNDHGYSALDMDIQELDNRGLQSQLLATITHRHGEPLEYSIETIDREPQLESRVTCIDLVEAVFPGICREHVSQLYESVTKFPDRLIAYILDKMEEGDVYPSAKKKKSLKRKRRPDDEDEEAVRKYGALDRIKPTGFGRDLM